jgi:uncharacterized protein YoxC
VTVNPVEGPASERMQALLSRAVEEQVSEQRQASSTLSELRSTISTLEASVRGAASNDTVARLDSTVSTVVADLRTSTTLLSQRLEVLTQRIEAIVGDTTAPIEQTSARLASLAAEVSSQAASVGRMSAALDNFGAFPQALSALQRDVAGLHDRLAPLADVQVAVHDLGARSRSNLDELGPQLAALDAKLGAIGAVPTSDRVRDAVVDALNPRLERLVQAAERPVVGPEVLRSGLGDLRASVVSTVGQALEPVVALLGELRTQVDGLVFEPADDEVSAGAVEHLQSKVAELAGMRDQLEGIGQGISALRSDTTGTAVRASLDALSAEVTALGERVVAPAAVPVDELSVQVGQRVADRLVEVLAPRIADVVLTRVSAALVTQLGEAIAPRLTAETEAAVRAASAESEKRVLTHVDEAVFALAEALLRRKGLKRPAGVAEEPTAPAVTEEPTAPAVTEELPAPVATATQPVEPQESVQTIVDRLAEEEPATPAAPARALGRPAVTTGLAPAPVSAQPAQQAQLASPAAKAPAKAPAAKSAPARTASAKGTSAKAAPAKKAPAKTVAKAPTPRKSAPAKKAAARPLSRPILEATPNLENGDVAPPRPRPTPAPVMPSPAVARPASWPAPTPPPPPQEPVKRKPWWKPSS